MKVPSGWFGQHPGVGGEGSWEFADHNPALTNRGLLEITLISAPDETDAWTPPPCPKQLEETRIDFCGFTSFGDRTWRHMFGETDTPFTEFATVAGNEFFRVIGFYPRRNAARLRHAVERIMRTSSIPPLFSCVGKQVILAEGEPVNERTGQHSLLFVLRNRSTRPCTLFGYPLVTLLDASGASMPFTYARHGDQMITNSKPRLVVVEPGARGFFGLNKYRCDRGDVTQAGRIEIDLLNGSVLTTSINDTRSFAYCGSNDPGDLVSVSPFEGTEAAISA